MFGTVKLPVEVMRRESCNVHVNALYSVVTMAINTTVIILNINQPRVFYLRQIIRRLDFPARRQRLALSIGPI
jgi:hypothetical protein